MKLDSELVMEIKKSNGDGTRRTRFPFLDDIRGAVAECSTPSVRTAFNKVFRNHSRAAVAVAVALTINDRREVLNKKVVRWADEVLNLWTNRPSDIDGMGIIDGLHPSRIEEYAALFINATTAEV